MASRKLSGTARALGNALLGKDTGVEQRVTCRVSSLARVRRCDLLTRGVPLGL